MMLQPRAASSVGSDVFAVIVLLVISGLTLLLLRHFLPLRQAPSYLTVPIFLALVLPASIILLVPIDLASIPASVSSPANAVWLPERVLLVAWRISYWLCFVLTWAILPLLGEYVDSGDREPRAKVLYSLRSNGKYYSVVLASCVAGFLYISLQLGLHVSSVKTLMMGLAYLWGLFVAVYLMGHGLVALPRRLFRKVSISGRLRRLQMEAPKVNGQLDEANGNLEGLEEQVWELQQKRNNVPRDFKEWIEDLADTAMLPESRVMSRETSAARSQRSSVPTVITDRYLADLTRKLARARHKRVRFVQAWDRLLGEAQYLLSVLDSAGSQQLTFGKPSPHASLMERLNILSPFTRYLLHFRVLPALAFVHGVFFSLASVCILWSEIMKAFKAQRFSPVSLSVVHSPRSDEISIRFINQLIAAAWIVYMCVAALTSMQEARIWGNRALVRRNTYGESACWYSSQIARLTVPLAYNFVTFFPERIHQETTYYRFLGHFLDRTALGEGFDRFFPLFILFPACATLFNLYGKAREFFGFGFLKDFDDEDEGGLGSWREGAALIERELSGMASHHDQPGSNGGARGNPPRVANSTRHGAPTLTVPRETNRPGQDRSIRTRERFAAEDGVQNDNDSDSDNFFTDFAHRVRNTVDTTSPPRWMKNIGEGFKKPKWMNNNDSGGGDNNALFRNNWFDSLGNNSNSNRRTNNGSTAQQGRIRL